MIRVLFVCLGNICRSPTADGVFTALVERRCLAARVVVDSCGTSDWHVGKPPDERATEVAATRGYDLSSLRARQVKLEDFSDYDYILAMDRSNLLDLKAMAPADYKGHLGLFLPFAKDAEVDEVPDPYYGGEDGFTTVLSLIEEASEGLLQVISGQLEKPDER
jgi:protein-tyrosine phosphatase